MVLDGLEEHSGSYIGDIQIHSSSWEEHLKHVREVLQRLKDNGLTAKPTKSVRLNTWDMWWEKEE